MPKFVWVCLTVLCSAACGADDAAPSKPARDAGERRDASEPRDTAADSGERDAGKAADAGSEDPPGKTLTIRFEASVNGEPFDCNRRYVLPSIGRVEPREFKFYVQDLALIDRDGKEVPVRMLERAPHQLRTVALIDFENATGSCISTPSTNTEILGKVPEGDYRGVVFTNGVPIELNHQDPTTFPPPLQDFSMYWNWFQGFKFLVADLGAAAPLDGEDDAGMAPAQSVLHVGSAACGSDANSQIQCANSNRNRIRLSGFDPASNVIVADLGAVFAGAARTETFCHGGGAKCGRIYRNVGLDLETGKAIDGQKVFRVE
ncbi:MAG TPA: MbnP family copper-binding protein [Polyangiales bacterium]|nr:MbnP family copper-binding protein [Polyangiales bacterium]